MSKEKIIEILTNWLIAARESPSDSDASLRLSAEAMYYEAFPHLEFPREQVIEWVKEIYSPTMEYSDSIVDRLELIWHGKYIIRHPEYVGPDRRIVRARRHRTRRTS